MSDSHLFRLGARRVFVGLDHSCADRHGWCSLRNLALSTPTPAELPWRLSVYELPSGYFQVLLGPGHPYADRSGKAYLHRLVMSAHLGRRLSRWEHVHHRNEVKADVSLFNLEILEEREHGRHHYARRARRSRGSR